MQTGYTYTLFVFVCGHPIQEDAKKIALRARARVCVDIDRVYYLHISKKMEKVLDPGLHTLRTVAPTPVHALDFRPSGSALSSLLLIFIEFCFPNTKVS